jgi:hypothetical protein
MSKEESKLLLYQYHHNSWPIPSSCPNCLYVQALLRILNCAYEVKDWNDRSISPNGEMPLLIDGDDLVGGAREIQKYLQKEGEEKLFSPQDRAFSILVTNVLNPALMYNFFKEKENFQVLKDTVYRKEFAAYPMGKYLASAKIAEVVLFTLAVCSLIP